MSASQGGGSAPSGAGSNARASAISSSYSESWRASSTRGAWDVGPTNRPENMYEIEG